MGSPFGPLRKLYFYQIITLFATFGKPVPVMTRTLCFIFVICLCFLLNLTLIYIASIYIPGYRNKLADLLSRQQVPTFLQLQPHAHHSPTPINQSTDLAALIPTMNNLFHHSLATSTWQVYQIAFHSYSRFCHLNGLPVKPVTEHTFILCHSHQ